jgi:hypothetical protein
MPHPQELQAAHNHFDDKESDHGPIHAAVEARLARRGSLGVLAFHIGESIAVMIETLVEAFALAQIGAQPGNILLCCDGFPDFLDDRIEARKVDVVALNQNPLLPQPLLEGCDRLLVASVGGVKIFHGRHMVPV